MKFAEFYKQAVKVKGGEAELKALWPQTLSADELAEIGDDRWLSHMTKCVFRAGFVWRVIEQKWAGFEDAFSGFNPQGMAHLSDERLAEIAQDERIVRNAQKVNTVRDNAIFVLDIAAEHGSFGEFIAHWPSDDIVGLWALFKKRGKRLGGNTGAMILRGMGKDTFVLSSDVCAALQKAEVISRPNPSSQTEMKAIQAAFNQWQQESGLKLCEISRTLAASIG
ncbi:MAG: DNA-3-methyladenine glycosylase I [Gammaproteobacteria bacterium]|nr:DNA-3-methyladenine glycosylase I [Gammaproteobacteria bacterium]